MARLWRKRPTCLTSIRLCAKYGEIWRSFSSYIALVYGTTTPASALIAGVRRKCFRQPQIARLGNNGLINRIVHISEYQVLCMFHVSLLFALGEYDVSSVDASPRCQRTWVIHDRSCAKRLGCTSCKGRKSDNFLPQLLFVFVVL